MKLCRPPTNSALFGEATNSIETDPDELRDADLIAQLNRHKEKVETHTRIMEKHKALVERHQARYEALQKKHQAEQKLHCSLQLQVQINPHDINNVLHKKRKPAHRPMP